MEWLDVISIFCTIISVFGSVKSMVYYKKSKQLTVFANTNIALIESKKIIETLTQVLKLAGNGKKRGTNYSKELSAYGESIKNSINKIREALPASKCKEINTILTSQGLKVEQYIDSFITGTVLVDEKLVIDDDFNQCQEMFCKIQLELKTMVEDIGERLK